MDKATLDLGSKEQDVKHKMLAAVKNTRKMNGYFFMVIVVKFD